MKVFAVHYCRRLDAELDEQYVQQLGQRHSVYDYNADDSKERKAFYDGFELAQDWVCLPWVVVCLREDLTNGTYLDERRFGYGRSGRRLAKLLLDGNMDNWSM